MSEVFRQNHSTEPSSRPRQRVNSVPAFTFILVSQVMFLLPTWYSGVDSSPFAVVMEYRFAYWKLPMESLPCEPTEALSLNISSQGAFGNQGSLFRIQAPPRDQKVPQPWSGWKRELPSRRSEALAKMREA